ISWRKKRFSLGVFSAPFCLENHLKINQLSIDFLPLDLGNIITCFKYKRLLSKAFSFCKIIA
ncbi:hypothetical protein, partial [Streptococcus suis]|uniref:hypothetical protein n=1 Tax=Streptococcus suis TaxID=1307 RepID=UPI002FCC3CDF